MLCVQIKNLPWHPFVLFRCPIIIVMNSSIWVSCFLMGCKTCPFHFIFFFYLLLLFFFFFFLYFLFHRATVTSRQDISALYILELHLISSAVDIQNLIILYKYKKWSKLPSWAWLNANPYKYKVIPTIRNASVTSQTC